jgi:hypothetical protein
LWIASKRRNTEEEQEDEKLMGVYNLRFFLKNIFYGRFLSKKIYGRFLPILCFMKDFFQFVITIFNFMFIS